MGDENVLELDGGDGCTNILTVTERYISKNKLIIWKIKIRINLHSKLSLMTQEDQIKGTGDTEL